MNAGGRGPGAEPPPTTTQPLKTLLWKWEGSRPAQRDRIIAYLRADLLVYKQAILDSINPKNDYCVAAIEIAGRLRLSEALSDIHELSRTGEPEIRGAAIIALNRLERLNDTQLKTYLEDRTEAALIATLAICAQRENPPVMLIVELLHDTRSAVREAAYKALPEKLPKEAQERLQQLLRIARPEVAKIVMRAIADTKGFDGGEEALLQRVQSSNWNVRVSALEALGRLGKPLESTVEIRRHFSQPTTTLEEKIACLTALEGTRSIDREWLGQIVANSHPVVRLHVARCYVRNGDNEGVPLLIDLLKTAEGDGIDDETVDYVRHAARKILSEIAGEDRGLAPKAWEEITQRMRDQGPMVIKFKPWKHW